MQIRPQRVKPVVHMLILPNLFTAPLEHCPAVKAEHCLAVKAKQLGSENIVWQ